MIDKKGKTARHVKSARSVTIALGRVFGPEFIHHEAPMNVAPEDNSRNEPEPDVMVLRRSFLDFTGNPEPADVALVVEVADSSLRQDLVTKAGLYARAGIPEYWVLDTKNRLLHVHRGPGEGAYRERFELGISESIAPLAKPDSAMDVAALLPE